MSRFMRLSPKIHGNQELPTRIAALSRGTYLAVQQALENIWFGKVPAIESACDHVRREYDEDVDEDNVKDAIAAFINLMVRMMGFDPLPEGVQALRKWREIDLVKAITAGFPEIEQLKQRKAELDAVREPLRREVLERDGEITKFRQRQREHKKNYENYQQRIEELRQSEGKLQADLEKIIGLCPIDLETCIATAQALKNNAEE